MKRFRMLIVILSMLSLTLSFATISNPVHAYTEAENTPTEADHYPETIIIDGIEMNTRIVTWEEYQSDETGDFLIVESEGAENPLARNVFKKVAVYLADKLIGYALEKGFEYLVTSGVAKDVALKAGAALLAVAPYAAMVAIGVGTAYMVVKGVSYVVNSFRNSSGCIWSGKNPYIGQWMCPLLL